jgi:hypothetical protein
LQEAFIPEGQLNPKEYLNGFSKNQEDPPASFFDGPFPCPKIELDICACSKNAVQAYCLNGVLF